MALAPLSAYNQGKVLGEFTHAETGARFDYTAAPDKLWDRTEFDKAVWQIDGTYRFAKVLKTVAHVIVDETEDGFVVESWPLKRHQVWQ